MIKVTGDLSDTGPPRSGVIVKSEHPVDENAAKLHPSVSSHAYPHAACVLMVDEALIRLLVESAITFDKAVVVQLGGMLVGT